MTKIDIIIGCMYSGKSEELQRRVRRFQAISKPCMVINSILDIRTDSTVKSHSNIKLSAYKVDKLLSITHNHEFINSEVIAIDEAQFFTDLYDFVIICESHNKDVIIAGLDGDSERKPFGQILNCITLCDSVIKLKAYDMISKDGSEAIFTKRLSTTEEKQISVGSTDKYISVNRNNYLNKNI